MGVVLVSGWGGVSRRRGELPSDWGRRRRLVVERDGGRCVLCGAAGNHVDHIVRGGDHSLGNLRLLCESCHMRRTVRDGGSAVRRPRPVWSRWDRPHHGLR